MAIDWTKSMQQTFRYYIVDPRTWKNETELTNMTSSSITWDLDAETLGSGSFDTTDELDECYIRTYLVCIQNGEKYEFPLGTMLVQTPGKSYNGRVGSFSMDAYTPLLELKDTKPPFGYSFLAGTSVLHAVSEAIADVIRAPVVSAKSDNELNGNFISDYDSDSWLSFTSSLLGSIAYRFGLDEMGRVMFIPVTDPDSMTPVWTYTDDNSSILYPDISIDRDLYGIPNVVEAMYSADDGFLFSRIENRDETSPTSITNRGREVVYRITNPDDLISPTQSQLDIYAKGLLKQLSTLEYSVSYDHGYCPVKVGDCVMLNYRRAGLVGVKAQVRSQKIECTTGCKVSETAVYTRKLWG